MRQSPGLLVIESLDGGHSSVAEVVWDTACHEFFGDRSCEKRSWRKNEATDYSGYQLQKARPALPLIKTLFGKKTLKQRQDT